MIVRHIREHLARRDWLAVALDLVIAVLGVFIGIQVSNWNQGRLNLAEGAEYRQRLVADLADNEADLSDLRGYYATVRAHAKAALAALDGPPGPKDAQFIVDAFEASQINPRKLKRFTYDEVLARGALTWLGDPKLREQVANYYVGMDTIGVTFGNVTGYRELLRREMPDAAQQAVRAACPERVLITSEGSGRAQLAEQCAILPLDPATIASAAAEVRAMTGIRGALNRLISDHDGKIMLTGPVIDHARTLRAQIAAAGE